MLVLSNLLITLHILNRFVSAWTNKHRHFNSTTTSRVESAHSAIKRNLTTSIGDLNLVFRRLDESISQQLQEINGDSTRQANSRLTGLGSLGFFSRVNSKVSTFALKIAYKEYAKMQIDRVTKDRSKKMKPCGNVLYTTMGIPCCHMMKSWLSSNSNVALSKSNFSEQWWLSGSLKFAFSNDAPIMSSMKFKEYPPMPTLTAETKQGEFMTEEDIIEEDAVKQQEWEQQCEEVDKYNETLKKRQEESNREKENSKKNSTSLSNLLSDSNIALLKQRYLLLTKMFTRLLN